MTGAEQEAITVLSERQDDLVDVLPPHQVTVGWRYYLLPCGHEVSAEQYRELIRGSGEDTTS